MKTFVVVEPRDAFRVYDLIRAELGKGLGLRITMESEVEPVPSVRRVLLWRLLGLLETVAVEGATGSYLTSRQWHQIAVQRALGFDWIDIDGQTHQAGCEPRHMRAPIFEAVAAEVLRLCERYDVDVSSIENDLPDSGPPQRPGTT